MINRVALVISNNDPDKKSKVQIRVLPEMIDVAEQDLPWAIPYKEQSKHAPPSIDSWVYVYIDDDWQNFKYSYTKYIPNDNIYENWSSLQNKLQASDVGTQTYPQPNLLLFDDGSAWFNNSDTGELGIIHNSGSYVCFTSNGDIIIYGGTSKKIKIYNGLSDLKSIIEDIRSVVQNLCTPGNLIGNMGAPIIYNQVGNDLPTIIEAGVNLDNLMED